MADTLSVTLYHKPTTKYGKQVEVKFVKLASPIDIVLFYFTSITNLSTSTESGIHITDVLAENCLVTSKTASTTTGNSYVIPDNFKCINNDNQDLRNLFYYKQGSSASSHLFAYLVFEDNTITFLSNYTSTAIPTYYLLGRVFSYNVAA